MQRARISRRVDSDGADAEVLGGTGDTAGNLAAIGNEDRFEHEARIVEHDGARQSLPFRAILAREIATRRSAHCPRAGAAAFVSDAGAGSEGLGGAGVAPFAAVPGGCGGSGSGQIGSTAACAPDPADRRAAGAGGLAAALRECRVEADP